MPKTEPVSEVALSPRPHIGPSISNVLNGRSIGVFEPEAFHAWQKPEAIIWEFPRPSAYLVKEAQDPHEVAVLPGN